MNATQIQALVRNMDESFRRHKRIKDQPEYQQKIMEENQVLYKEYPSIFKLHMEGKLDETFFYMLSMRRKIEKGELTEDEASVQVGQKLFRRFVDPVVNNLPAVTPGSYEEFYKQSTK
jgi:hypothetical protein